jgi:hypothetical protein
MKVNHADAGQKSTECADHPEEHWPIARNKRTTIPPTVSLDLHLTNGVEEVNIDQ